MYDERNDAMRKALITGSEGFVGRYLRRELTDHGYDVTGVDIAVSDEAEPKTVIKADLLDAQAVLAVIKEQRPDIIIHLAGQADVGRSWKIPAKTMEINVCAAINLMEAVRVVDKDIRIVLVGSSDEYGVLGERGENVSEDMPLRPTTPYAVSKQAQEQMAQIYVRAYGMNVCMTRSFNHGGAGQREGFAIPDFAAGMVRVERGLRDAMYVGNLESRRDFTHVKDVVRAYRLIAERGVPGRIYNVGSGEVSRMQDVLDRIIAMSTCRISVKQDPERMRPSDTPVVRCDHTLLTQDTGWEPRYTIDDIVKDTVEYYRQVVG